MKEVIVRIILIILLSRIDTLLDYLITPKAPHPQSPIALAIPHWLFTIGLVTFTLSSIFLSKKGNSWPYLLAYTVPLMTWFAANYGNYWTILWSVFGIIPLMELVAGADTENPSPEEEKELNNRYSFRLITMLWVPLQLLLLFWGCWAVSKWQLSLFEFVMLTISIGFNSGILGINISHELIHKKNFLEVYLGKILLISVFYGHWYVEHLWGHHKQVSTPSDPATSRFGENFYSFWFRSVKGGFQSAWHLEQERLKKKSLPWWHNEVIALHACSVALAGVFFFMWGSKALIMFLGQSVTAFSLLEIVNYIEHYGLERHVSDKGTYEPVNPTHSWNANTRVTNYFLFKLQRHSDHHAHAGRRYQILRSFDEAPQMPTGYAGMLLLALIPPLWFWVMNKRAKDYYSKRLTGNDE